MRTFVLLFLSCASLFGADEGIKVVTTTKTNSGVILTQTVFTRDGQTNLIRSTMTLRGKVQSPDHKFYHNGFLVGHISSMANFSVFAGAADCPYSLEGSFRTNGGVWWAEICTKDGVVVDWFTATNGLFWPAPRSEVQNMSKMTTALSAGDTKTVLALIAPSYRMIMHSFQKSTNVVFVTIAESTSGPIGLVTSQDPTWKSRSFRISQAEFEKTWSALMLSGAESYAGQGRTYDMAAYYVFSAGYRRAKPTNYVVSVAKASDALVALAKQFRGYAK